MFAKCKSIVEFMPLGFSYCHWRFQTILSQLIQQTLVERWVTYGDQRCISARRWTTKRTSQNRRRPQPYELDIIFHRMTMLSGGVEVEFAKKSSSVATVFTQRWMDSPCHSIEAAKFVPRCWTPVGQASLGVEMFPVQLPRKVASLAVGM